jgi:hypothetical protein
MGAGLSVVRATAARHDLEALYLVAYLFVVGGVGEEHQAVSTGVWVGILAIVFGTEYARLSSVHSEPPSSVGRVPRSGYSCGTTSLSNILIIRYCFCFVYEIVLEFLWT